MPATASVEVHLSDREEFEALLLFAGEVGRLALDRRDTEMASLVVGLTRKLGIVSRNPESTLAAIAEMHEPYSLQRLIDLAGPAT